MAETKERAQSYEAALLARAEEAARLRSLAVEPGPRYGYSADYDDLAKPPPGLVEKGTMDLTRRQVVDHPMPGADYGTEYSANNQIGGKEVLYPTIFGGKLNDEAEAEARVLKTGEHMGKFKVPDDAAGYKAIEDYANKLHARKQFVAGQEFHGPDKFKGDDRMRALVNAGVLGLVGR